MFPSNECHKMAATKQGFLLNFDGMHNHNNERRKNVFGKYIFIILTALSRQEVAGNVKHNIYSSSQIGHPLRDQLLRTTHIYIYIYIYIRERERERERSIDIQMDR